ncbi:transketolase family protein [Szabonella alba]|uniref:Transketolase n=1 Tax=Szabonella alba TaxID=2804194 RepID=A0A8K0XYU8_9RHOB|nr:transketolase [Szabonella alba]MBL4916440.1 transketolase [Szabonella alba]
MADIQRMAEAIRFLALDAILNAGEGHQGVPLGMAEIAATLYARHLRADPADPLWPDRDRVVLSNGHGSMLLYTLLHLSGYAHMPLQALRDFRRLGSVCAGHPEIEQAAGIEITTGLLGQGIACAVGMAVAEARLADRFPGLVDHRTWAFVGDGCLQEGVGQEAISLAGHLRLGKLTFLWDDNAITDDGATDLSVSEDIPARFVAAGWHVQAVDGHDIAQIDAAMTAAKADPRPSLIACRTVIARGIPRLQGQRGGHSAPLTAQDAAEARAARGWTHPPFEVPQEVLADWRALQNRGGAERAEWAARHATHPERAEFDRWQAGLLPEGWEAPLSDLPQGTPQPTIAASADACAALDRTLPELMVLCADLEAPTDHKRHRRAFSAENRGGSYVHCGVREHLMGAMCCGIAAHGGLRSVNVTYLAFADYERPAMRMAALMGLPVLFVFSHDSIGIGSNGPTHQPVEALAAYRSMPNMQVMRPADAVETHEAWALAMPHRSGPVMLALSRQAALPVRAPAQSPLSAPGGYVLQDPGARDVTLIATGTEVGLAMEASRQLAGQGLRAAVVSLPCWERFETLTETERAAILGSAPRIAIEAALRFGWDRWLRPGDAFIGMEGFGASARAEVLYRHFGITAERITETATALMAAQGGGRRV